MLSILPLSSETRNTGAVVPALAAAAARFLCGRGYRCLHNYTCALLLPSEHSPVISCRQRPPLGLFIGITEPMPSKTRTSAQLFQTIFRSSIPRIHICKYLKLLTCSKLVYTSFLELLKPFFFTCKCFKHLMLQNTSYLKFTTLNNCFG